MAEDALVDGWIAVDQACELTGYSPPYLRQLARENRVKAEKIGRAWYFSEVSVRSWRDRMKALGTKKHDPKGTLGRDGVSQT